VLIGGTSIQAPASVTLQSAYKEVGRAATMIRAFIACNRVLNGRYRAAVAPMVQSVIDSYYHTGHGWPYQEQTDFTLYRGGGVTQDWITSEATGHAVRALLSLQVACGVGG
jgi:hypothetical protein